MYTIKILFHFILFTCSCKYMKFFRFVFQLSLVPDFGLFCPFFLIYGFNKNKPKKRILHIVYHKGIPSPKRQNKTANPRPIHGERLLAVFNFRSREEELLPPLTASGTRGPQARRLPKAVTANHSDFVCFPDIFVPLVLPKDTGHPPP